MTLRLRAAGAADEQLLGRLLWLAVHWDAVPPPLFGGAARPGGRPLAAGGEPEVAKSNPAVALYERLGVGELGDSWTMLRRIA